MKRSFPTHIIYVARDKEKLIADIIDSDYDTEEKTLRILSIDAEKRNRKICDHVIHNDIIEGNYVSGAEELRRLIATAEGKTQEQIRCRMLTCRQESNMLYFGMIK